MTGYTSTSTFADLAQRIRNAPRLLVLTHRKPDGDAMGSALALSRGLSATHEVGIHLVGPVGQSLRELAGDTPITVSDEPPVTEPDLVILVDTGSWVQIGPLSDWLKSMRDSHRIIGLDHHPVGDDIAAERIVEPGTASCTMLVLQLLQELGVSIDAQPNGVGEAIFAGLVTDTGWFQHSNADAACFATASYLLERGIDRVRLHRMLEQTSSPGRLKLMAKATMSTKYELDGRCAVMRLEDQDFVDAGAGREELEGVVNQPLMVGSVEVSVLLYEEASGATKISLRSKPPRSAGGSFIDVSAVGQALGGGGHVHASGARYDGDIESAIQAVLGVIQTQECSDVS